MSAPVFSRKTVDTLAKRARYQCSNPDCGVATVGPNTDPEKSTLIGEAAHIMGAKPGSMRYSSEMSDATRAAITNGIWLCRNCHAQVDRDDVKFPASLLFKWRHVHEEFVAKELGTRGDRLRYEEEMSPLRLLEGYGPLVQRIAIDKPEGWEWRLTAELMRELNRPQLKRLRNLQLGHYYKPSRFVPEDSLLTWLNERTEVMSRLTEPLLRLFERLTEAWGSHGASGDLEEIHDTCVLIRDALKNMVDAEEILHFAHIPDEGEELRKVLMDSIGANAQKLEQIPLKLDEAVALIGTDHGGTADNPTTVELELVFDLPNDFEKNFERAFARFKRRVKRTWL